MSLVKTVDEYFEIVRLDLTKHPYKVYYPIKDYFQQQTKIQMAILGFDQTTFEQTFSHLFVDSNSIMTKNPKGYQMRTKKGLLRSSYEIYFYKKFHDLELNKIYDLEIDKRYPNSNLRFDFKLTHSDVCYTIEICPMIHVKSEENYRLKMQHKQKIFKCWLLSSIEQIDQFFQKVANVD